MEPFEFLKYMVEEEHKALDKLISELTDEELDAPIIEKGETTIRDRIEHILNAEYRMAGYLYKPKKEDKFRIERNDKSGLLEASNKAKNRHKLTLDNLSSDDLGKVWISEASGNSYDYQFLLWHFIEHIATHRGQIATALRRIRK